MGGAVAMGAIAKGIVAAENVTISHMDPKMEPFFVEWMDKITIEDDNATSVGDSDLVVVAVKPWLMEEVLGEIAPKLNRQKQALVSIAAGITFEQLNQYLSSDKLGAMALYRVIPNTAIAIGESVTLVCKDNTTSVQDSLLLTLLDALGKTFVIGEDMMTPLTSLSSCGIAFAYKYIDASMEGGVEVGIEQQMALEVVLQTVRGAVKMLENNKTLPQTEIDKVTTKGGITIKGLDAMVAANFVDAVKDGVKFSK